MGLRGVTITKLLFIKRNDEKIFEIRLNKIRFCYTMDYSLTPSQNQKRKVL